MSINMPLWNLCKIETRQDSLFKSILLPAFLPHWIRPEQKYSWDVSKYTGGGGGGVVMAIWTMSKHKLISPHMGFPNRLKTTAHFSGETDKMRGERDKGRGNIIIWKQKQVYCDIIFASCSLHLFIKSSTGVNTDIFSHSVSGLVWPESSLELPNLRQPERCTCLQTV